MKREGRSSDHQKFPKSFYLDIYVRESSTLSFIGRALKIHDARAIADIKKTYLAFKAA